MLDFSICVFILSMYEYYNFTWYLLHFKLRKTLYSSIKDAEIYLYVLPNIYLNMPSYFWRTLEFFILCYLYISGHFLKKDIPVTMKLCRNVKHHYRSHNSGFTIFGIMTLWTIQAVVLVCGFSSSLCLKIVWYIFMKLKLSENEKPSEFICKRQEP